MNEKKANTYTLGLFLTSFLRTYYSLKGFLWAINWPEEVLHFEAGAEELEVGKRDFTIKKALCDAYY